MAKRRARQFQSGPCIRRCKVTIQHRHSFLSYSFSRTIYSIDREKRLIPASHQADRRNQGNGPPSAKKYHSLRRISQRTPGPQHHRTTHPLHLEPPCNMYGPKPRSNPSASRPAPYGPRSSVLGAGPHSVPPAWRTGSSQQRNSAAQSSSEGTKILISGLPFDVEKEAVVVWLYLAGSFSRA